MHDDLTIKKCVPCEGGSVPMNTQQANEYLSAVLQWELVEDKKIRKEFVCKGFREAVDLVNRIAGIAEAENHHPTITIIYNKVKVTCWTHAIGGLSENDFIIAAKIDKAYVA